MEVSEIIKKRRKELGLTLKQVADEMGVSESLISRYENKDVKNMGIDKLIPLAKILKCSPAYLLGWENEVKFRNNIVHGCELSSDEKINFIKSIENYINSGMTYEEISQILNFPQIEKTLIKLIFKKDLLILAKQDKDIFELLADSINSITKKLFNDSNLSFDENDIQINRETFEQIINKETTAQVLEKELNKYKIEDSNISKKINNILEKIKTQVKEIKENGRKNHFDISFPNGKSIEFKKIGKDFFIFIFNINDNPLEIKYSKLPFSEEIDYSEQKMSYEYISKKIIEEGEFFFNNPKIPFEIKEKTFNKFQDCYFKIKFNKNF